MKKKLLSVVFVALFLLLSLTPSLGILLVGEGDALANETRARKPELRTESGSLNNMVLKDFSEYFSDRIAFRKELITAWAKVDSAVFHTSAEQQVVLGSDDWLYFSPTLDDYMGRALPDEKLESIAENLAMIQSFCEEKGARFLFTIAPNKNSVYPEHMPAWIVSDHSASNAEKLRPYLEKYGVNYLDLFALLDGQEQTLYYRTDTHWTNRGAALAADALLASAGIGSDYFGADYIPGEPHSGDLYEMLFPTGAQREPSEDYAPGFRFTALRNPNGGETNIFSTHSDAGKGSLLCWRDSFGNALFPYLAESFEDAKFIKPGRYDLSEVEKQGADLVILELVERNLYMISDSEAFTFPES